MKGVIKYIACYILVLQPLLNGQFNPKMNFNVMLPKQSRWGVFLSKKPINQLKSTCSPELLDDSSIKNNKATGGVLKGNADFFQLCPCLINGVSYWNPLTIAYEDNP